MKKQIAAVLILGTALFGCTNQKKVTRWNNDHPQQAAEYAGDHFPCRPSDTTINLSIDSGAYLQSIEDLSESVNMLNEINDSLLYRLMNIDTSCRQYVPVITSLQHQVADLKIQVKNVRPKIVTNIRTITIIDSSKAVATRLKNAELEKKNNDQEKEILKLKGTSRTRFWMLISSGLLNSLLLFLLFKKKKNPILEKL